MFITMCSSDPWSRAWVTNIVTGCAAKIGASPWRSCAQKAPAMNTRLASVGSAM